MPRYQELCIQISDKIDQLGQQLQSQRPDGQKELNETDVLLDYHVMSARSFISAFAEYDGYNKRGNHRVKLVEGDFGLEIQAYIRRLAEQRCKTGNNKL